MFNWFNIAPALIIGSIVLIIIIKAVMHTKTELDKALKDVNLTNRDELARKLVQKIYTQNIDLSRFEDPVTEQTDWSPAKGGGSSFATHSITKVGSSRIEFQASGGARVFSIIFILMGVGTAFSFSFIHISQGTFSLSLDTVAPLLFGTVFAAIGGGMYYYFTVPIVFDKSTGSFYKGRKVPGKESGNNAMKYFASLEEIHALQLISENCRSDDNSYHSYELNLVLKDGRRINVVDHGNESKLREDARTLSRFIDRPVWDAIS